MMPMVLNTKFPRKVWYLSARDRFEQFNSQKQVIASTERIFPQ